MDGKKGKQGDGSEGLKLLLDNGFCLLETVTGVEELYFFKFVHSGLTFWKMLIRIRSKV